MYVGVPHVVRLELATPVAWAAAAAVVAAAAAAAAAADAADAAADAFINIITVLAERAANHARKENRTSFARAEA